MTLLGRQRELAAIDGLLVEVGQRGGSLVVRGEAGIGKSALLEEAERRAGELGMTVLKTAGVPSERTMAFAGLHRLLLPYAAGIADLPPPQAGALSSAFGLGDASGAVDLFLVALAALDLVTDAAAKRPLLITVEDAHWLDADTSEVLGFVARRVNLEPVAMIFAVRDGHASRLDDAGLAELRLANLDARESADLLDAHAPDLGPDTRRRVLEAARGNPLGLLELPHALVGHGLDRPSDLVPLPITDALERAFLERVSALPAVTQTVLLVAALDDAASLTELLEAASVVAARPVTVAELEPADAIGLVEITDAGVHFRHPLVRAAVYQAALTPARRAAHAALADAHASDPDRSVWHRAASCAGPDMQIASDLEAVGVRALQRGAPAVAAAAFERAAQLTADPETRGSLLLQAAEMEFELGRSDLALGLLEQARPLELGDRERPRLILLFEAADEDNWSGPARVATFAAIAERMVGSDEPERAIRGLLTVARSCWWGNATQATRDLVVAAVERLDLPDDSPARLALLGCTDPVGQGAHVNGRIAQMAHNGVGDPAGMHLIGTAATTVWAFDTALPFLGAAIEGLRAQGRLGLLAQALVSQAWTAVHVAKAPLAVSAAAESARLARETGQPRWAAAADLVIATVAGERGDFATMDRLADAAEAELLPVGAQAMLALVQFARGRGAVAHQRYADGYEHLVRVLDPADVAYHPFVGSWALADLIEAAAQLGRHDDARLHLAELERLADTTGGPLLRASLAYARPLLAPDAQAGELYQDALGGALSAWPCYRARVLLAYGRWLRRRRRVAESRAPLRAARESADALSFHGLAESARQELRASGETSRRRVPEAWDQLTPQELQIAQLASQGLSNREIGQRLYLSHRTVGSHLYRMFPKLGITSRAQLAPALAPQRPGRREAVVMG